MELDQNADNRNKLRLVNIFNNRLTCQKNFYLYVPRACLTEYTTQGRYHASVKKKLLNVSNANFSFKNQKKGKKLIE